MAALLAGVVACATLTATALPAVEDEAVASILMASGRWTEAPAYLDLFVPRVHRNAYSALVSTASLDTVLRTLSDSPALLHPPGAWQARSLGPADVFGLSAPYNRWTVAQVYGATPARIARGPRGDSR